jgi:hypothetical protein
MLRSLALAFLGLSVMAGPAAARSDGPGASRRAAVVKGGGGGSAKTAKAFLLRRAVAVQSAACARASRRGGGSGGALRCRGGDLVRAVSWSWAQDLPPALDVQAQECPAGTMATLAEGHDDIVRCIPI